MPIGNALAVIRRQKETFFEFDIVISSDKSAWNLSVELTALGWNGISPIRGKVKINAGVIISGIATTNTNRNGGVSFFVDTYNNKSQISIENYGSIVGSGGFGGSGQTTTGSLGGKGGTALHVNSFIRLLNNGVINGGGGGGGGNVGGGGGGAGIPAGGGGAGANACMDYGGKNPCYIAKVGSIGTTTTGGDGGIPTPPALPAWADRPNGGKGGSLGANGITSGALRRWPYTYTGKGGDGGYSVFNWGKVTLDPTSTGTFLGAKI